MLLLLTPPYRPIFVVPVLPLLLLLLLLLTMAMAESGKTGIGVGWYHIPNPLEEGGTPAIQQQIIDRKLLLPNYTVVS